MKFKTKEQILKEQKQRKENERRLLKEARKAKKASVKSKIDYKGVFPPSVAIPLVLAVLIIGGCLGMTVASEVIGGLI